MAEQDFGLSRRQRYREASLIGVVLAALALAILFEGWAWRAERVFYDLGLSLSSRVAPDDIAIVAIDDRSIAEIGVWPWRRAVHATLLERLAGARARAVFLDLLLSEPDPDPRQDALLGRALRTAAPVLLPVAWYNPANAPPLLLEPVDALRDVASLVQAEAQPDSDGILRHVFLRAGLGRADLRHAALALLEAGGEVLPARLQIERAPPKSGDGSRTWVRDERLAIRFQGRPGLLRRVSYVDVLSGAVPAETLHGKYVLVGMTAVGMADAHATPMGGEYGEMPGIEVIGQTLQSLRRGLP